MPGPGRLVVRPVLTFLRAALGQDRPTAPTRSSTSPASVPNHSYVHEAVPQHGPSPRPLRRASRSAGSSRNTITGSPTPSIACGRSWPIPTIAPRRALMHEGRVLLRYVQARQRRRPGRQRRPARPRLQRAPLERDQGHRRRLPVARRRREPRPPAAGPPGDCAGTLRSPPVAGETARALTRRRRRRTCTRLAAGLPVAARNDL